MKPCENCAIAKAKQKNVVQESLHVPTAASERRIFLDLARVRKKDEETDKELVKPFWRIVVDERTNLKFTEFFATKDGMVEPTCEQIYRWNQANLPVKTVRWDDGGENFRLKARANSVDWKLNLDFEFTPRNTPQHNHMAELAFYTVACKARAMMIAANIPKEVKHLVFRSAVKTATLLDGLMAEDVNGKLQTRYKQFCGKKPKVCVSPSHLGRGRNCYFEKRMEC